MSAHSDAAIDGRVGNAIAADTGSRQTFLFKACHINLPTNLLTPTVSLKRYPSLRDKLCVCLPLKLHITALAL